MWSRLLAVVPLTLIFAAPAPPAQHFASSLGAVSDLCTFQSGVFDYNPALLADFSKPSPEVNSFANQGLIIGLSGEKGALDELAVFDQNRLEPTPINLNMGITGGKFEFRGAQHELKLGASAHPTTECDITFNGQTFVFELKTIDPQFIQFWLGKLNAMTGSAEKPAKSLAKHISKHNQYWMMKN